MNESRFFWLAFFIVSGYLLYLLSPILAPFLIAAFLAYLGDPICDTLEAKGCSRTLSVTIVFAAIFIGFGLIILVLIPTLETQISGMLGNIPLYAAWLNDNVLAKIAKLLSFERRDFNIEGLQTAITNNWGSASTLLNKIFVQIRGQAGTMLLWFTYLFMIPVVTFYFLRDWDVMLHKIESLLPRAHARQLVELARRSDEVLSGFLRGQLLVMLFLGVAYSVGLSLIGLESSILIGMMAGLVSFVPYLGLVLGLIVAMLVAVLQFHDWTHPMAVLMVFGVIQTVESTVVTPKLVGDRTGLHPVAVLFAVLAGGQLFGFMGMLLGLPVAAVMNVFLNHFKDSYLQSDIYRNYRPDRKLPDEQYINLQPNDGIAEAVVGDAEK